MYVKCINNEYYEKTLIIDEIYEVERISNSLTKLKGFETRFDSSRFIIVEGHQDPPGPPSQVDHPTHYNKGIETWDYTDSWEMDFLEGNIIKYVTRWKEKGGIEDLNKAMNYLKRLIERESKKNV